MGLFGILSLVKGVYMHKHKAGMRNTKIISGYWSACKCAHCHLLYHITFFFLLPTAFGHLEQQCYGVKFSALHCFNSVRVQGVDWGGHWDTAHHVLATVTQSLWHLARQHTRSYLPYPASAPQPSLPVSLLSPPPPCPSSSWAGRSVCWAGELTVTGHSSCFILCYTGGQLTPVKSCFEEVCVYSFPLFSLFPASWQFSVGCARDSILCSWLYNFCLECGRAQASLLASSFPPSSPSLCFWPPPLLVHIV